MSVVASWLIDLAGTGGAQAATGIRSTRLLDYAIGKVKPRSATIKKLTNAYRRVNFGELRESGFGSRAANSLKGRSPFVSRQFSSILESSIENIARREGIGIETVRESMRRSDKAEPELTRYQAGVRPVEELEE